MFLLAIGIMMASLKNNAHIIYFNFAWYGIAYFAVKGFYWVTMLIALVAYLIVWKQKNLATPFLRKAYQQALVLCGLGLLFDVIMHFYGVVQFANMGGGLLPLWLVSIWVLFASVLPTLALTFKDRPIIGSMVAAISAPLSYLIAEKMTLLQFVFRQSYFIYVVFWFFFFYFSIRKLSKLNKEVAL